MMISAKINSNTSNLITTILNNNKKKILLEHNKHTIKSPKPEN